MADHAWKPSTEVGYRSNVRALTHDPVGGLRAQQALPRWERAGATPAVVGARFRVVRSALSWAYDERLIDLHPIRHMRGPSRPPPRRPVSDDQVRRLLTTAEAALLEAIANDHGTRAATVRRHRCELDLLLVRLAADTGARRGELATLRRSDLNRRVLSIERSESAGRLTTPKSGHARQLTIGTHTALLWHDLDAGWQNRAADTDAELGPWLFSADPGHERRLTAGALGHRFTDLRDAPTYPRPPCTASGTTSPPSSSPAARSSRPRRASDTPTPPPPSASTPTPCRSPTRPSPSPSTGTSTDWTRPPTLAVREVRRAAPTGSLRRLQPGG